jgi:hypothetical protein
MTDDVLTTSALAKRLGKSRDTVWRWQCEDPRFAQCVLRRTKRSTTWSVQRLIDLGFLKRDTEATPPALSYSLRVAQ